MAKMSVKRRLSGEEGFTLLEAVISIAAIAFVSGFILEMFIVSADLNARSRATDLGGSLAVSAVELFKKQKAPNDYAREDFFRSGLVNSGDDGQIIILKGYDESFNETLVDLRNDTDPPKELKFMLSVKVDRKETDGLYSISAAVIDYNRFPAISEIIRLDAEKYFGRTV
ncbi:MAG: hypothetical protein LBL35_01850 [Clostridiales bacterium]|jgi:type II secretory pathway pseudopilin PulG|nr:hypothetical protein [Clostridiales bacterium]